MESAVCPPHMEKKNKITRLQTFLNYSVNHTLRGNKKPAWKAGHD
jgi:hypothetical protein